MERKVLAENHDKKIEINAECETMSDRGIARHRLSFMVTLHDSTVLGKDIVLAACHTCHVLQRKTTSASGLLQELGAASVLLLSPKKASFAWRVVHRFGCTALLKASRPHVVVHENSPNFDASVFEGFGLQGGLFLPESNADGTAIQAPAEVHAVDPR